VARPQPEPHPDDDVLSPLRCDDDGWLGLVQQAERPIPRSSIAGYEILAEIRSGGQALVFHARDPDSGREVALKRLAHGAFASEAARRRFEREVAATSSLQHPGIVSVYGTERAAGVDVLVMEWVRGERLDAWARRGARGAAVALQDRLRMLLQVCDAVQHAHQNGVIHRDLKPSNVLVDEQGRCRVLDFGMAQRLPSGDDEHTLETLTEGFGGTLAYASPESLDPDAPRPDARTDVYSLGVMLFELIEDRRPFGGGSMRELLEQVERHEAPRLRGGAIARARDLDAVVRTALRKRPDDRYTTVNELATDLRRYLDGLPVAAVPPTTTYLLRRWIGRHRAAFAAACALAALALVAAGIFVAQRDQIVAERDAATGARIAADAALAEAQAANERARAEARAARDVADFYLDLVRAAAPAGPQRAGDFYEVLRSASATARERLAATPEWVAEIEANMALWMCHRGENEEAIELAQRALELQRRSGAAVATTSSLLHRVIGEARAQLGDTDAAITSMRAAVDALAGLDRWRHMRSVARNSLGRTLQRAQRLDEAEEVLRAAITDADDAEASDAAVIARAGLAMVLTEAERLDEAAQLLDDAEARIDADTSDTTRWTVFVAKGDLLTRRGEPQAAVTPLRAAAELAERILVEAHPERALSRFRLAAALRAAGQEHEAPLRRALALGLDGGELPIAHEMLATLLARRGDLQPSAEQYELAWNAFDEQLIPAHGRRVVAFANWLASLIRAGRTERAREQFPALLAQVRACATLGGCASPVYWRRVAEIGDVLGDGARARTELRAALAELRASEAGEHPQVDAIAEVVEQL